MAPRESKVTPKMQNVKTTNTLKKTSLPNNSILKKTTTKKIEHTPRKGNTTETCQNTACTPKPKENKPAICPGSVTRSAKKAWKRRPKPAHSGVPVPEKMKRLLLKKLQDDDCDF